MDKLKQILFFTPTFSSGGAEAFIVNLIEQLDRKHYTPELLSIDAVPGVYDERLIRAGIQRRTLVNKTISNPVTRYVKAYKAFRRFMAVNSGKYDVIHFNIAQGEELPFIHMAKKAGIPIRILHSHNSSVNSKIKYFGHILCKGFYKNDTTDYLACSDIAARWLLPPSVFSSGEYKIIKNGIDVDKYGYKEEQRKLKREELGLGDASVFLNIGRLNHQKNQSFLIDAFRLIHQTLPTAVLLVAGEGDLRQELEKKAEECGLKDSIWWLGNRNDVPELLSSADVFLLPSLFEGLPYTIIEAQASGIQCVIADTISEECVITDLVERVKLDSEEYARVAINAYENRKAARSDYTAAVSEAGFDIHRTVAEMEEIYRG